MLHKRSNHGHFSLHRQYRISLGEFFHPSQGSPQHEKEKKKPLEIYPKCTPGKWRTKELTNDRQMEKNIDD